MENKYGFTDKQFAEFKTRLHSKIHWLLVYKENDEYSNDFLFDYFKSTMQFIG